MDCVDLDEDISDEMNATTKGRSIAKTMKRYPDPNNDKTEADSNQQRKAKLVPDNIVCKQQRHCIRCQRRAIQQPKWRQVLKRVGTMTRNFRDPLKFKKGQF